VVIDPTAGVESALAGVPPDLIAGPAHAWNFEPVRN
jgi:hypothetical protein